jgi:cytochrome P450
VVRINPRELHIKDPHYYDEVYAPASQRREKDPRFVGIFGFPYSMIATVGHDLHRFRRGLLNNFFSKKSVLELSPMMHEKESKLMKRIEQAHYNNSVVQLDDAFAALTADLISQYSWGVSSGFLDDDNFNNDIRQALNEISTFVHVNRFFPFLGAAMRTLPRWFLARIRPGATAVLDMQDVVGQQSSENKTSKNSRKTIFDALSDPKVPAQERSPRRLEDEGLIVVVAGTETTARTLTLASFYLYQNKPLLEKLRKELRSVMPTPTTEASWPQLEQLPYLVGLVSILTRNIIS